MLRTATALVLILLVSQSTSALPTFARKYKSSCVTCHESFPRLNAIGEAFRLDGYQFIDDELYIKDEPVELGDEAYKRLWPKSAVWPASIPGLPPVSFQLQSDLNYDVGGRKTARTDFVFPTEAEIFSAGRIGDNISFLFEVGFEQGGGDEEEGGEVEVEAQGWLQFEDLFGLYDKINLRVGTVGMQELGLFTARNHNRLTLNPYLYSSWSIPAPGEHIVEELFGEGAAVQTSPFNLRPQPGIEVNGFGQRWRYAVGIVNGNGSVSDDNSEKDFYLQLAYKFGGRGFDGIGKEGEGSLGGSGDPWRDDSWTLSLFGYRGTGTIRIAGLEREENFWRFGPGVRWKHNDFALNAGYIWGSNSDPYGAIATKAVDSESWFLEAEYFVYPWLTTTARYEGLKLDLDEGIASLFIPPHQNRERLILSAKALVRANLSMTLEGRFHTKDERFTRSLRRGDKNDDDQIALSMALAF